MPAPRPRRVRTADLKSRFLNVAQTSVYIVKLQPPSAVLSLLNSKGFNYGIAGDDVELSCTAASLPGQNLFTHDATNDYTGVTERMAYRKDYGDGGKVSFSFNVNQKYDAVEMFDTWIDFIGGQTDDPQRYLSPAASFRMNYPDTYKSNIYITKFEKGVDNKNVNRGLFSESNYKLDYTFVNAFPTSTGSMQVSYESSNVLKLDVTMSYTRYVRERSVVL